MRLEERMMASIGRRTISSRGSELPREAARANASSVTFGVGCSVPRRPLGPAIGLKITAEEPRSVLGRRARDVVMAEPHVLRAVDLLKPPPVAVIVRVADMPSSSGTGSTSCRPRDDYAGSLAVDLIDGQRSIRPSTACTPVGVKPHGVSSPSRATRRAKSVGKHRRLACKIRELA
jgi:hypothetical protein